MDPLVFLAIFALLGLAVWLVGAPLRQAVRPEPLQAPDDARREELQAARDAKYREIRDAEMDFRTGKLSEDDFRGLDRQLRGEAVEILRELDALG